MIRIVFGCIKLLSDKEICFVVFSEGEGKRWRVCIRGEAFVSSKGLEPECVMSSYCTEQRLAQSTAYGRMGPASGTGTISHKYCVFQTGAVTIWTNC